MKIIKYNLLPFYGFKKSPKTLFSLFLLLIFAQISVIAQNDSPQDFLVLRTGDTLYGTVAHINTKSVSPKFYKKIRLAGTHGKLKKFKRSEVLSFQANADLYEQFLLSQSSEKITLSNPKYNIDQQNGELCFLKRIRKGKLSHYLLEWFEQGDATPYSMDLLKKEQDSYLIRATQGLLGLKKKVLTNYFTDCPLLQENLREKKLNTVTQVVDFYTTNCTY